MKDSVGKRVARELFYNACMPAWLLPEQIRAGNVLVLLGDEPRELPLLDRLGVPRNHVLSVERDYATFRKQMDLKLNVSLYYGQMADYLNYLLHSNQGFAILNLDVEGTYLAQLDPAMTSVFLFCWRNPETVVATYSSIGRDRRTLWEGVRSLAILLWLAPEATRSALATLEARYRSVRFRESVHMALRDLFWVRSALEHNLVSARVVGVVPDVVMADYFGQTEQLWAGLVSQAKRPLRLSALCEAASSLTPASVEPCLRVHVANLRRVLYTASRPWWQSCTFVKFALAARVSLSQWCSATLSHFTQEPLTFVGANGNRRELCGRKEAAALSERTVVWRDAGLYRSFTPRTLAVPQQSALHRNLWQTAASLRRHS